MRIVLDMQAVQAGIYKNGISHYSLSLAKALVRNQGEHQIVISLSGLFPRTIEPLCELFRDKLPQEDIHVWYAPGPVQARVDKNRWRINTAELLREAFLTNLEPDVVHIFNLIDGFDNDVITSIGLYAQSILTSTMVFDLRPLSDPLRFLENRPDFERYYMRKIDHLRRASILVPISNHARMQLVELLNLSVDSAVNVPPAADDCFKPHDLDPRSSKDLKRKYNIRDQFILHKFINYSQKDIRELINAFAQLPVQFRNNHQLVLSGELQEDSLNHLLHAATDTGLARDEFVLTGLLCDEKMNELYNLSKLCISSSSHDDLGISALEAMSCGKAVLGLNTSNLPEIIGREDAIIEMGNAASISSKIERVLSNESYRFELERSSLEQANGFSWDTSAKRLISIIEEEQKKHPEIVNVSCKPKTRPKMAFISPLPPERSGISDYSAELIPGLSQYYDIEVVVDQDLVSDPWVNALCPVRNIEFFLSNSDRYERVIYHFGNSPFHQHMFGMIDKVPGLVVLHDFFLSGIMGYMDITTGQAPGSWVTELYHSHGYPATHEYFHTPDKSSIAWNYPCNLSVIQKAIGVIVHSEFSRKLGNEWYPGVKSENWAVIPSLRKPIHSMDRVASRKALDIRSNDFLVCSFGLLNPLKLNDRLLDAWLETDLAKSNNAKLVFVGENHDGEYGNNLLSRIRSSNMGDKIQITGWVDRKTFHDYLAAADIGIQLRTLSRGETPRTALDCMSYGLPTVVNAHASLDELPDDAVFKLQDQFSNAQLTEALDNLWQDGNLREQIGTRAREVITSRHSPQSCAADYFNTIEYLYIKMQSRPNTLINSIVSIVGNKPDESECVALAQAIADSFPQTPPARRLFLDITATCRWSKRTTGVERVTHAIIKKYLKDPPEGFRVEPVYLSKEGGFWHYRFARRYTLELLNCPHNALADDIVEPSKGDLLIGLDISSQVLIEAEQSGMFSKYKDAGIQIYFVLYDLLPILHPEFFPPGSDSVHKAWLETITNFDGAVCISQTVAEDLREWLKDNYDERSGPFKIGWFHLGSDVDAKASTRGLPDGAKKVLENIGSSFSFLLVGTIEPRKGHLQVLDAFTSLWNLGHDINLVIVGNEGWKKYSDNNRKTIPETVTRIKNHPEYGKRLMWLEGISDEYLQSIYDHTTCLLATSEVEGFGLPIVEAARNNLPIIARDIPVFNEVAGDNAYYFSGNSGSDLDEAIRAWISLYRADKHPKSQDIELYTWDESAGELLGIILDQSWFSTISGMPQSYFLTQDAINKGDTIKPEVPYASRIAELEELKYLEELIDFEGKMIRGPLSGKEVLIYSPAKTGTVSLFWMIAPFLKERARDLIPEYLLLHNHNNDLLISNLQIPEHLSVSELRKRYVIRDLLRYKEINGGHVQIISSYRDPLLRNISDTFQAFETMVFKHKMMDLNDITLESCYERLQQSIQDSLNRVHPLEEIDEVFFDKYKFDHSTKCCYVDRNHYEILALCLEHSSHWPAALDKYLGYRNAKLITLNVGAEKEYAHIRREFEQNLTLDSDLIWEIYFGDHLEKKYLRWFYTEKEIKTFYQHALSKFGPDRKE